MKTGTRRSPEQLADLESRIAGILDSIALFHVPDCAGGLSCKCSETYAARQREHEMKIGWDYA